MQTTLTRADELIGFYGLSAHPEGGFYRETYRAEGSIRHQALPETFSGDRSFATAIYYLLRAGERSRLHRIAADEIWHFYGGDPMWVIAIAPDGTVQETLLGNDFAKGQQVQHVVPGGCWFGAIPAEGSEYAFVGCTVAPGFDFADFEMGNRATLLAQYPHATEWIRQLT